jgi:hypothetical protein
MFCACVVLLTNLGVCGGRARNAQVRSDGEVVAASCGFMGVHALVCADARVRYGGMRGGVQARKARQCEREGRGSVVGG